MWERDTGKTNSVYCKYSKSVMAVQNRASNLANHFLTDELNATSHKPGQIKPYEVIPPQSYKPKILIDY